MIPLFVKTPRLSFALGDAFSVTLSRVLVLLLALLAGASATLPAQPRTERRSRTVATANAAGQSDDPFEVFRTIGERNIFDPNRQPRIRRDAPTETPTPADEVISFVGTLQYEKGLFAFFDGTDPLYRMTLPTGGTIAGFSVTQIAPQSVSLTANDRLLTLRMGESLRRRQGTDWAVSTLPQPLADVSTPSATSSSRPASTAIPSDASATLRRLMEQRQKQLKE